MGGDGDRAARELNCGMRVFDEPRQSTAGADDMQAGPAIEALSGILGDDPRRFLGEGRNRAAGESPGCRFATLQQELVFVYGLPFLLLHLLM